MGSFPTSGALRLGFLRLFTGSIALAVIVVRDLDIAYAVLVDVAVFHGNKDFACKEITVGDPAGAVRSFTILPFAGHTFGKFSIAVMFIFQTAFESAAGS